jgi:hypothetical protein
MARGFSDDSDLDDGPARQLSWRELVNAYEIPRGPGKDSLERTELLASGDGRASKEFNYHEAIQTWETF